MTTKQRFDLTTPHDLRLTDGAAFSSDSWHGVSEAAMPYRVFVRLGKGDDGRLVISGLAIGVDTPVEVTARGLRKIPLAPILADLARSRWMPLLLEATIGAVRRPVRRGPRGLEDEHFAEVAATYRQALVESPRTPLAAFRRIMPSSESTARRWIQRARDRGLLGPAVPGKPGEGPRTDGSKR